MEINWESIKYIFQIPRDWYRYIHRKINNAYGTLFIRVMDGEYGGMKIDVDRTLFKEAVEDVAGLSEYVKSVDAIPPDKNGNVTLEGYVKSVSGVEPDEKGNVDLDANFLAPSDLTTPGIVVGTDYKGKNTVCSPNHKHNVKDIVGAIKTVNGNSPDETGNVVVEAGIKTVNNIQPDVNGNVDLGKLVKTVNSYEPDENGNIQFDVVEKVDGVSPIAGNVPLGAIRSINNTIKPVNGNVNLDGVYAPIQHEHPHTQISDWDNATKNFLDSLDITTPGILVGTDYADPDHPVCSPNHKHNSKDIVNSDTDGFVTIDTQQEISGLKLFTSTLNVGNTGETGSMKTGVQLQPTGVIVANGDKPGIAFFSPNSNVYEGYLGYDSSSNTMQFCSTGSRFLIGNSAENDYTIQITASQNQAQLASSPSTDGSAPDLAIATVGWVKEKAITVPDGKTVQTKYVTIVSDVQWNGTQIRVKKQQLEFSNGVLTNVKAAADGIIDTVAYTAN